MLVFPELLLMFPNIMIFFIFFQAGKNLAMSHECKYIEVSAGLNHKTDELLVGILRQIRLKRNLTTSNSHNNKFQDEANHEGPKGIVGRLFRRNSRAFRSCDNLMVSWHAPKCFWNNVLKKLHHVKSWHKRTDTWWSYLECYERWMIPGTGSGNRMLVVQETDMTLPDSAGVTNSIYMISTDKQTVIITLKGSSLYF